MVSILYLFETDEVPTYGRKITITYGKQGSYQLYDKDTPVSMHIVATTLPNSTITESAPQYDVKKDPSIDGKFMIHQHHANRAGLHYDLRLGQNGVLLSWATRKLPELIDGEVARIMLFRQPDHDASWFNFHGEITDGYGAGKVQMWDKGTYEITKSTDIMRTVIFDGKKLKGKYTFLLYNKEKNEWLFFQSR
jgi:DNA ligase D-like protein (predicted 3'-phosphoesterase)